jgi:hypothetical protein
MSASIVFGISITRQKEMFLPTTIGMGFVLKAAFKLRRLRIPPFRFVESWVPIKHLS